MTHAVAQLIGRIRYVRLALILANFPLLVTGWWLGVVDFIGPFVIGALWLAAIWKRLNSDAPVTALWPALTIPAGFCLLTAVGVGILVETGWAGDELGGPLVGLAFGVTATFALCIGFLGGLTRPTRRGRAS